MSEHGLKHFFFNRMACEISRLTLALIHYLPLLLLFLIGVGCGEKVLPFPIDDHTQVTRGEGPPNVVFILADDVGWRDLGVYGSDYYQTPQLDQFAQSAMRFTHSYSASPLCSPTRASILIGQEPGRLRLTLPIVEKSDDKIILDPKLRTSTQPWQKTAVPESLTRLPNEYETFAEVLKENGYTTAFMGKWHLGKAPHIPENQGFDVVVGGRDYAGPPPPGNYFAPWDGDTLPGAPAGTHIAEALTDAAIDFVSRQRNSPFLLCLWYYDVHGPFQAKWPLVDQARRRQTPDQIQRNPTMAAMIETMDANIGRFLAHLSELGLDENTIVIFTSDNGGNSYHIFDGAPATNNYPLRGGKGVNYEGGVRVPMMVRAPGVTAPGTVSDVMVSSVDHYVSILELLGIPMPARHVTDGVSYVPALNGQSFERPPMYSLFPANLATTGSRANLAMRDGPWRMYKFYYDGPLRTHRYELYNLSYDDIGEQVNLVAEHADIADKMRDSMALREIEAGYLLPQWNKRYRGDGFGLWHISPDATLSYDDGEPVVQFFAGGGYLETRYFPYVSEGDYWLEFELKSSGTGNGAVVWLDDDKIRWEVAHSISFAPTHDNLWHRYRILLQMDSRARVLRVFPSESEGEIQLKNVVLKTPDEQRIFDWPVH
ncbi:MAG: sulfatase [Deltaproteobacteria bacterium]|nr:sulfatase [Deltaproteobacteria bacterium]